MLVNGRNVIESLKLMERPVGARSVMEFAWFKCRLDFELDAMNKRQDP
jgi:hypothetical protein